MTRGFWTIAHFRGAPIRLHWTLPLGALVMSNFRFVPAFWLGFTLLILIHELGHALLVLRFGLGLSEIVVHGAGGYCRHEHHGSPLQQALVAWGGVLAQLAALVVCQLALLVLGPPTSMQLAILVHVFTTANLWIIGFNLLPVEPLDGAKAWRLVPLLLRRQPSQDAPSRTWLGRRRTVTETLRDLERTPRPDLLQDLEPAPRPSSAGKVATAAPSRSPETSQERTDRIVRDLIARTTQSKREP